MFYVLTRNGTRPGRWADDFPYIEGLRWRKGQRFTVPVPIPLRVTLKPLRRTSVDHGPEVPEYLAGDFPIFREDLISALRSAGVDNLDTYQVELFDPDNGKSVLSHQAINIVGVVAAADMARSDATVHDGVPLVDVDFDRLAVDESRSSGLLMFRLAESTNAILVHQRVRDHLEAQGFYNLDFHEPGTVAL